MGCAAKKRSPDESSQGHAFFGPPPPAVVFVVFVLVDAVKITPTPLKIVFVFCWPHNGVNAAQGEICPQGEDFMLGLSV